jgi:hypothetical protein
MRRGPAATADPDLLGVALARRVPLRGGRNARPVSSGPSGPTRGQAERLQAASSPSGRPGRGRRRPRTNELMAMQWACDRGGLLCGQPAGEHQTERVGTA